ncbi:hypothetical protein GWI34_07060 [Actinomadura sp. DSM 109109]|nr:hypothetical protein [Actinomadura lepetitiana]
MAPAAWSGLGSPGEVMWARSSGDAGVIAVGTAGGHLYLRRRAETGSRWEHLGTPPGATGVLDAALVPAGPGAATPVVVGDDLRVWRHDPGAAGTPWTDLGGPDPDENLPARGECGDITVITSPGGGTPRHTLVVSSATGRPWIRQGVEPGTAWTRLTPDDDLVVLELAAALAFAAPGQEPQPHVFAVAEDPGGRLRVAVLENSAWTWFELGGPQPGNGLSVEGLSATEIRDSGGRLQACAVVRQTITGKVGMVIGSGRDWQWVDLGRPPVEGQLGAAVLAAKGPAPQPGDEPVVVARVGHHLWTRSRTGAWTDLGTTPQDVAVVEPAAASEVTTAEGRRAVRATGVSWASDLWTVESDDTGVRWERHGCPVAVASVPGVSIGPNMLHVLDGKGALWSCELWMDPPDGFFNPGAWTHHGPPAPGVAAATGVGVLNMEGSEPRPTWVFVVGGDGRLWARTAVDQDGLASWSWVDHGVPAGQSIVTAVPPLATDLPDGFPTVFALADDGRIWMHPAGAGRAPWIDCGGPQGQLISRFVGAAAPISLAGLLPAAVVITNDGRLWIADSIDSGGGSFTWSPLGTPAPGETLIAGIGIEVVTDPPDSNALDIVVLGSPSGHVWRLRWARGTPPRWTTHGQPAGAPVRGAIGTMPDPADPAGCLIAVIGKDRQVWVTRSATAGAWTRWDPPSETTTIIDGRAMPLQDLPCAVVLDGDRRLHVVAPRPG